MSEGWWDRFHRAHPEGRRVSWELIDRFGDRDLTTLSHQEAAELQATTNTLMRMVREHALMEGAPAPVEETA